MVSTTLQFYINDGFSSNSFLMFMSPDASTLAIAATDSTHGDIVAFVKVTPGAKPGLKLLKTIPFSSIGGVTWSADDKFLAAFSTSHLTNPGPIVVWNMQDFSRAGTPQTGANSDLMSLAWSSSSNYYLAAGDNNGTIYIWRYYPNNSTGPGTGNDLPILTLSGPAKAKVLSLAWSHDGRWLAAGFNDINDSIYVWDSSRWQG
jgi:WD40 repeat protein